jgi:DNA-binding winged helix-turn-helix (wHTH) protein/hemoglobin-like flavoprotein
VQLRFGDCVLDLRKRELRRAGAHVPMQPKVLEVLCFLLEHRERAVTRVELHDAVWPDVIVGPSSLSRAIREVRKAIGDQGDAPEMVRTLSGHGFRFVAEVREESDEPAGPAPASSRVVALHGRDRELGALLAALARARTGRVIVRVVSGEPGIGKTHLLDGLAVRAPIDTCTLRTRVSSADTGAPLAMWRDLWGELGLDLDDVPNDEAREGRRRRAERTREALQRTAGGKTCLLIVDDADRADASSWRLVEDLLDAPRALPLLLVLTVRAQSHRWPDVARAIATAVRADPDATLELTPLDDDGVEALLASLLDRPPSRAAVARLARLSGGHPLFVRQLVHAAQRAGRALETLELGSLPRGGGLRELVLSYVSDLGVERRDVIEAAATLPLPFSTDLVAEVADARPADVADALAAAEDAGLLEPAERGRRAFVHEIVRDLVVGELAPSRAAALHRRAAHALDRRLGGAPEHLELLAHHYVRGAADGDAARALAVVHEAARHAARAGAFDVAARHLGAALDVEALLPVDAGRRSALAFEHGVALARDGRVEEAARAFAEAAPRGRAQRTNELRAAFHAIAGDLPRVVARFYELLFARHPSTRALFTRSEPTVQRRMFGETLVALAEHADDEGWLDAHMTALGRRHAEYGVEDAMYAWVREAFLDAVREAAGREGLPALVERAWAHTYDAVAAKMIAATHAARVTR